MALVILRDVQKSFRAELLFTGITFQINEGDRIGLIGNNGTGKTTLLEIICGQMGVDGGEVITSPRNTYGYLPQTLSWTHEGTIGDYLWEAFSEQLTIQKKLEELEEKISLEALEEHLDEYAQLREEFEEKGGYSCESLIKGILNGLGFSDLSLDRPLKNFSGGEKTKIALSRLLLEEPDLLILDEPTNHLDRENREWLANFLKDYRGSLFVVSHDRYFLDQITNRIMEIEGKRLYSYEGNYSAYKGQREIAIRTWQKEYDKQQEEIAALEDFVRRYKAGQRTKEARSRERQLEKMVLINPPPQERKKIKISFPLAKASGQEVLKVKDLSIKKGKQYLFDNVNLELWRGDKVALLGANGTGKTSFLKALLGLENVEKGKIEWGHGVSFGYFEQEGDSLAEEKSVFDVVADAGLNYKQDIMDLCGAFRFSGEEAEKTIEQLSGGELARLNIALLTLKEANVLFLDEPTNHLDIDLQEWLADALERYISTVIFTSHDRYFIEAIANVFWKIEGGRIYSFKGSYERFLEWERRQGKKELLPVKKKEKPRLKKDPVKVNLKKEQERLEAEIAKLEDEIHEMEKTFSDPDFYQSTENLDLITKDYQGKKEILEQLYEEWEETTSP